MASNKEPEIKVINVGPTRGPLEVLMDPPRFNPPPFQLTVPEKRVAYEKPGGPELRPRKEQAFMVFAAEMAKRATCDRRQVGAVFADAKLERILCAGYNGSYAGGPNGCDSHEPGLCGCIHAEINALTKSRDDLTGSICFVTTSPCKMCAKVLVNRGVKLVIFLENYRKDEGLEILRDAGIEVVKYADLPGG